MSNEDSKDKGLREKRKEGDVRNMKGVIRWMDNFIPS